VIKVSDHAQLNEIKAEIENIFFRNDLETIREITGKIVNLHNNHMPFKQIIEWFEEIEEDGFVVAISAIFFKEIGQVKAAKLEALRGRQNFNDFPHWDEIIQSILLAEFYEEDSQ
jgi:hypothetical protein